jgi:ribosome-binding protein aMBF1 (putative translation factor)
MNHGTERNRKRWEAMTPDQRATVEAIRAKHRSSEHRSREEKARQAVRSEFPPRHADDDLKSALVELRHERERQGLRLTDMHERTRIDRGTISKLERGELANPTVGTLRTYPAALGKRLRLSIVD